MNRRAAVAAVVAASISLVLLFQNCGGQFQGQGALSASSTLDSNSVDSSSGDSSSTGTGGVSVPPAPTTTTMPYYAPTTTTTVPANSGGGSSGGGTAARGQACVDHFNYMGWNGDPQQLIDVDMNPVDSFDSSGAAEVYSYGGFGFMFTGPKRPGATSTESYYYKMSPIMAGITIKLRDAASGNAIALQDSDFGTSTTPTPVSFADGNFMGFNSDRGATRFSAKVKREFFERNRSQLGYIFIELYCQDKLISKGYQDFQALAVDMTRKMVKTSTGGYTGKDPDLGFTRLTCPLEAVAGSTISCNSFVLNLQSNYYLHNSVRDSAFDNRQVIEVPSATAGTHYLQAISKYKNGIEDRSTVRTVRVK